MRIQILWMFLMLTTVSIGNTQSIKRYDVVIAELFPDPSPAINLPDAEFIELKNRTSQVIDLFHWKITDGTTSATINEHILLMPDSMLIVCGTSGIALYRVWGTTVAVSNFPSLNNDADAIVLLGKNGETVHAVSYEKSWFRNDLKANGGWSLEMIDPDNPCGMASNWTASTHSAGGTPGRTNSQHGINRDETMPVLLRAYVWDSVTIVAVFDEILDSLSASNRLQYSIDSYRSAEIEANPIAPFFNEVFLKLPVPMLANKMYELVVKGVRDCSNNEIGKLNTTNIGIPIAAEPGSIVINELLFNPPAEGCDYIELYNKGPAIVDLSTLFVGNRLITGSISNIEPVSVANWLLFAGEYIVIGQDPGWIAKSFSIQYANRMLRLTAMPSMPDDKGTIVLMNEQGKLIDELTYDEKWHFPLLHDRNAVALERINYTHPTQLAANWTSAASTVGFGTPGYQNSQLATSGLSNANLDASPKIFSPDNDGRDDFVLITLISDTPGSVATITIFDATGRTTRIIAKNATLSTKNTFRWDGFADNLKRATRGSYIVFAEIFDLTGKVRKFKAVVVVW
ncbi:MAG: lamin tail domain-containing protein [Chitinophagaceae bacterium]|nr:lamin tail domain-containing protein [Chitinophagaceae bacterium]